MITRRFLVSMPTHLLIIAIVLGLIQLIGDQHEWWRAGLMMIWGAVVLPDLLTLFFDPWPRLRVIGRSVLFLAAVVLIIGFLVWVVSTIIWVPIFNGIHNFVFSIPSLPCALLLLFAVFAWVIGEEEVAGPEW